MAENTLDKYDNLPRFNSYTKEESRQAAVACERAAGSWRVVVNLTQPTWTDEQFDKEWDHFLQRRAIRSTCGGSC